MKIIRKLTEKEIRKPKRSKWRIYVILNLKKNSKEIKGKEQTKNKKKIINENNHKKGKNIIGILKGM